MRIEIETQVYKREIRTPRQWGAATRPAIALLLVALTGLTSCKHASSNSNAITCTTSSSSSSTSTQTCTDPTTGISITISPATITLNVDTFQTFNVSLSGGTNNAFTLKVNGVVHGDDADGTIDSAGLYHTPVTVPSKNPVSITATSVEDSNLTATSTVTINPPPTLTITPPGPPYSGTVTSGASAANAVTFTANESGGQTGDMIYWCVTPVVGGKAQSAIPGGDSTNGLITTTGANGGNGVYTPPLTPPVGQQVMVTAALSPAGVVPPLTDCQVSAVSVAVMISGFSISSLQGQFAFSLSGQTTSGSRFYRAGSFHADGAGNLSSVMETINGASGVTLGTFDGTFTIAPDGRGTLTFNDGLGPAPSNASNFDFVLVDGSHLQIIGFDTAGTSAGEATAQVLSTFSGDPLSALTGTYVFDFSGVHGANALSQIGEFNVSVSHAITGGSIDINDGGAQTQYQVAGNQPLCGAALPPASQSSYTVTANGLGSLTLKLLDSMCNPVSTLTYGFYVVSKGGAKFVGTDMTQAVAGVTLEQQLPAAGRPFDNKYLSGNYAFLLTNQGTNYASAGSLFADGNGGVTSGVLDENSSGTPNTNVALASTTYQIASSGRGVIMPTGGRAYVFYLGPTGTAVFQETDAAHASDGVFNQQQGAMASSAVTFGGTGYAVNDTGTIAAGNEDATYIINSVTGSGAVLAFTITSAGTGYSVGAGNKTATGGAQPGMGTGFTVDILTIMFSLPSIRGNYALATNGLSTVAPETLTGEMTTDGAGNVPSGTADVTTNGANTAGLGLTGSYAAAMTASERGTLTLKLGSPLSQTRSFAVYVVSSSPVSSSQVFVLEVDVSNPVHLAAGQLLLRY